MTRDVPSVDEAARGIDRFEDEDRRTEGHESQSPQARRLPAKLAIQSNQRACAHRRYQTKKHLAKIQRIHDRVIGC